VFDYFLAGLPVVSTPTIPLWEFADLIYFGETAEEFSLAISQALEEPAHSPKRTIRAQVARAHSTEALARCLAEIPVFSRTSGRSEN